MHIKAFFTHLSIKIFGNEMYYLGDAMYTKQLCQNYFLLYVLFSFIQFTIFLNNFVTITFCLGKSRNTKIIYCIIDFYLTELERAKI